MQDVKGMVQHGGVTYRIVKIDHAKYEVIRILDENRIGTFETLPRLRIQTEMGEDRVLLDVTITALKQAKISWPRMRAPIAPVAPIRAVASETLVAAARTLKVT